MKDIYSYIVLQNTHLTLIQFSLETLQFSTVIKHINSKGFSVHENVYMHTYVMITVAVLHYICPKGGKIWDLQTRSLRVTSLT